MVEIRLPNITGLTEKEQLAQIKSYLFQLAGQLQFELTSIDGEINSLKETVSTSERDKK